MTSSTTEAQATPDDVRPDARRASRPGITGVIAGSMVSGGVVAALLCLFVFPGAVEPVITGSALLGFGAGWVLLAAWSRLHGRPQRWAWLPGLVMSTCGALMIAITPGPTALSALGWVWPPAMAVVAVYCTMAMRRDLVGFGRWLLYPVFVAMLLASTGGSYLKLAHVGDSLPAPGEMYEVDGHDVHLDCRGAGSPTVVVQAGLGGLSAAWARVMPGVEGTTRICAFDRAGQGWSEESSQPKDGLHAASDLHAVLAAAGERGPYVMAGHSTGGTYALTYAATYPEDVAGMVLVDSSSPDQFTVLPSFPGEFRIARRVVALLPSVSRLGLGELVPASFFPDLPEPAAAQVQAISTSAHGLRNQRDEQAAIADLFRQAQALSSLGDKPLVVLTATVGAAEGWGTAQDRLAALSTNSSHRLVGTDHGGMLADVNGSAASVEAIADVVSVVRDGSSIPHGGGH
jgi:pimeloyl-ACP methyl ester carboxylesterase